MSVTYSFIDVAADIFGPGGSFPLGFGAGNAEEGITVTKAQKNTKTIGADGSGMHSLHADESGMISVHLLKTSPTNSLLQNLYSFQRSSSALWGQNTLEVTNLVSGDAYTALLGAFSKFPENNFKQVGNILVWEFDFVFIDPILGVGFPPSGFIG